MGCVPDHVFPTVNNGCDRWNVHQTVAPVLHTNPPTELTLSRSGVHWPNTLMAYACVHVCLIILCVSACACSTFFPFTWIQMAHESHGCTGSLSTLMSLKTAINTLKPIKVGDGSVAQVWLALLFQSVGTALHFSLVVYSFTVELSRGPRQKHGERTFSNETGPKPPHPFCSFSRVPPETIWQTMVKKDRLWRRKTTSRSWTTHTPSAVVLSSLLFGINIMCWYDFLILCCGGGGGC